MNTDEATKVVRTLVAAWPKADMPEETLRTWVQVLSEFAYEDCCVAAESIVRNDTFFPTIARLREAIMSVRREMKVRWASPAECPSCDGQILQRDSQGRDWLCRCSVWTYVRPPEQPNVEPKEFLAACRNLLKKAS